MRETILSNLEGLRLASTSMERDHFEQVIMEQFDALRARISALEAEQRWIPVSERLPDKSGWYLTVSDEGIFIDLAYFELSSSHHYARPDGFMGWQDRHYEWYEDGDVTHWMPKPPPPDTCDMEDK